MGTAFHFRMPGIAEKLVFVLADRCPEPTAIDRYERWAPSRASLRSARFETINGANAPIVAFIIPLGERS